MRTTTLEDYSDLIAGIYDAALDSSLWLGLLERTASFVNGATAGLLSKNSISNVGDVHYSYGVDDSYLRSYRETYWQFDPLAPLTFSEIGEVTARGDFVADGEFLDGRFYREWVKPQGMIDAACVVLDRRGESFALFSSIRSEDQGRVDAEMRRRIGLLVPHLRRSVLISQLLRRTEQRSADLGQLIDTLSSGVFLLTGTGALAHTNAAGRAMLDAGTSVRLSAGRLTASTRQAAKELAAAMKAAASGDAALGDLGIATSLPGDGDNPFVAHVLPMHGSGARHVDSGISVAVFVQPATLDPLPIPKIIANTYALTPAELRVMLQVTQTAGVAETASMLGVGEATVKTHLSRVFAKTGLSRQAELVRLVAGFSVALSHRRATREDPPASQDATSTHICNAGEDVDWWVRTDSNRGPAD